jgi:hypothetical protein
LHEVPSFELPDQGVRVEAVGQALTRRAFFGRWSRIMLGDSPSTSIRSARHRWRERQASALLMSSPMPETMRLNTRKTKTMPMTTSRMAETVHVIV